jgi:hypothetical protein
MTDKELLELAAKAAGFVEPHSYREKTNSLLWISESGFPSTWRPLDDNADAFELAVKLGMQITIILDGDDGDHSPKTMVDLATEEHGNDSYAATRRAIVRAAAEIGKAKCE